MTPLFQSVVVLPFLNTEQPNTGVSGVAGMALAGDSLAFAGLCGDLGAGDASPNKSASMPPFYTCDFLAATNTGSNGEKAPEMPAEGKGERQSAGTASGGLRTGNFRSPAFSHQKQGTPARNPYVKLSNGGVVLSMSPAFPDVEDDKREGRL